MTMGPGMGLKWARREDLGLFVGLFCSLVETQI